MPKRTRRIPAAPPSMAPPAAAGHLPQAFRSLGALLFTTILYVSIVLVLVSLLRVQLVEKTLLAPFRTAVASWTAEALNILGFAAAHKGSRIMYANLSVQILNECTGLEAVILLVAAILVFPAPWRAKGVGLLASLVVMALVNFLRIVSLCYVGAYSVALLEIGHLYVWPVAVIITGLVTLLVWVEHSAAANR